MNARIFIVSFHRDAAFLNYCLRSIQKFATGFSGVTVAVPFRDEALFRFVKGFGCELCLFDEWSNKGMLHHEVEVINADRHCPDADLIFHFDSDVMCWEPMTPADYLDGGRPILLRERYATLQNKLRLNWKTAVRNAVGIDPEWETMLRLPLVYLPETHRKTRELIERHTGRMWSEYILSCQNDFPQSFAEHPTLGAVAIEHFPEKYSLVEYNVFTHDGGYDYRHGKDRCTTYWTHGGVDQYRERCEAILR